MMLSDPIGSIHAGLQKAHARYQLQTGKVGVIEGGPVPPPAQMLRWPGVHWQAADVNRTPPRLNPALVQNPIGLRLVNLGLVSRRWTRSAYQP